MRPSCLPFKWVFEKLPGWILRTSTQRVPGWASGSSKPPWRLANLCADVEVLASTHNVSFAPVKHSANEVVDALTKRGVGVEILLSRMLIL